MQLNPYIAGNPIRDHKKFFGREDIFQKVMRILLNSQNNAIVLYGQRRIGKTSILLQLEKRLLTETSFIPIYFDLQDKATYSLKDVLYELAIYIGDITRSPLPAKTFFDEEGVYFRQTFLPKAAKNAGSGGLILLFDEFDVWDAQSQHQAGQTFLPYLRDWMSDLDNVQFVFVIGRRPEELSLATMSTFKGVRSTRVTLLEKEPFTQLVRHSEQVNSLQWTDEAVECIWQWTHGHPYLTQLLASIVWEDTYDESETTPIYAQKEDVEAGLSEVLQQAENAFVWIWSGLPPAHRVVMSAIAEAGNTLIDDQKLVDILNQSGIRLILRELEVAPETLQQWDLLHRVGDGYQFAVPLLRLWVARNRPLRRVKEELDRLEPLAHGLWQTGQKFYSMGQLKDAENDLRRALNYNQNHLKARLLLGQILLETNQVEEAVKTFEEAYEYDREAGQADLIRALLILTTKQETNERISTYKHVLSVFPTQPIATRELMNLAQETEERNDWVTALDIYQYLNQLTPSTISTEQLKTIQQKLEIAQKYDEALYRLETNQQSRAAQLFAEILVNNPYYRETILYTLQAIKGIDLQELEEDLTKQGVLITEQSNTIEYLEDIVAHKDLELEEAKRQNKTLQEENKDLQKANNLIKKEDLNTASPWDFIRMIVWVYFKPAQWLEIQEKFTTNTFKQVGSQLSAILMWLPLFYPLYALVIGTLPGAEENFSTWKPGIMLAIGWSFANLLGHTYTKRAGFITVVTSTLASIYVTFYLAETIGQLIIMSTPWSLIFIASLIWASVGAGITAGIAGGPASSNAAFGATGGIAGSMTGIFFFYQGGFIIGLVSFGIAFVLVGGLTDIFTIKVAHHIKERKQWFIRILGIAGILSHATLASFSFFSHFFLFPS